MIVKQALGVETKGFPGNQAAVHGGIPPARLSATVGAASVTLLYI